MDSVTVALDTTFTQQPHTRQNDPDRTTPRETWKGHRACFECRRHVNRDMRQPSCGLCKRTGGSCTFPTKRKAPALRRPPVGRQNNHRIDPRKLERLVDLLESRLSDGHDVDMLAQQLSQTEHLIARPRDNDLHTPASLDYREQDQQMRDGSTGESGSTIRTPTSVLDSALDNHNADDSTSPAISLRSMSDEHLDGDGYSGWWLAVPEQILTDLVHLFFDKIQAWLPLLHRPRFFDRYMKNGVFDKISQQSFSDTESLLLCGVFSLAARHSLSPWLQDIPAPDRGQRFADDANRYYEMLRPSDKGPTLEYLQGCILLAFYQYASGPSHRAWILSGVCVRLAYDLNLCNMDEQQDNLEDSKDWSYLEEKRRAFWLVWEVDTFGSVMSRRPSSINRSMMAVRLPVGDAAWFADKPIKSPVIDPRPPEVWKILLDSPNQDERAWFLVANLLMSVASEFAAGRHTCQRDKDELVDAITCFSLIISQRFNLETLGFSGPSNDAARHNWVIGMHLMLTCARATIQASFTTQRPGVLSLPRHMSHIFYQWHPESIALSQPFFACCLLSDRAYPSEETVQAPNTPHNSIEIVNLVLSQYASIWKLASVLLDLRASLIRHDHLSSGASFETRFALYFPRVSPRRHKIHKDGQSNLMRESTRKETRDDNRVVDENGSGRVGPPQLFQPSGNLEGTEAGMVDLTSMPGRELSKFVHLDDQNDWDTQLLLDYVCDDNQQFNYLQL